MFLNRFAKSYWKTNLRLLLVLPFVIQIAVGLGVVGYLSYRSGQRALEEITLKLRQELGFRISDHVEEFINNGNDLNTIHENYLQLNPDLLEDLTELGRYFTSQYQWNDQVNLIAFASNDGDYIEVYKRKSKELELTIVDQDKSNALLTYLVNEQGNIVKLLKTQTDYTFNPLQESWYTDTVKNQENHWHQVERKAENEQGRRLVFINSKKIYDRDGKFIGVVTNQSNLINLSTFLSKLKIGKTGSAFIINRQGILMADSNSLDYGNLHSKESFMLRVATKNQNEHTKQISDYILTNKRALNNLDTDQLLELKVGDKDLLIEINSFDKMNGIDWLIVLVIPKSDFTDFITRNNRVTVALLIVGLIMAIVSGLITSKLIVKPIITLQDASQKISQGEFNQKVPLQGIKELDTLANTFNNMTDMLESFFNDLNKSFQEVSNLKYAIDQSAIVTVTDPEGVIVYCNQKLTEISGYTPDELIGNKTSKLKSNCHQESFYNKMWTQISDCQVWRGEIRNKAKDGSCYWVDTTIVPLTDETGNIVQYLSIQSEITERKELEKNLEEIVLIRTQELAKANQEITTLNKRLCSENIQMSGKLRILHEMQQLILPTTDELKQIKCLDIAGYMEPADELGGDYYDVLAGDNTITIGIGDVTGHGLESGLLMVMTQAAICTLKQRGETDPLKFLDTLNRAIYYNVRRMNSEKNLSLAIINYFKGNVCISGQHEEVIVVRHQEQTDNVIELIDTIDLGLPIGIDEDIRAYIDHTIITLNTEDGIVLYTDGITEARDVEKNQYGIDRLCKVIKENWHLNSEKIRDTVIKDVKKFIGLQKIEDDLTLLILKQR